MVGFVVGRPDASVLAVRFELVLCQLFGFCRGGLLRGAPGLATVFETWTQSDCRGVVCFSDKAAVSTTPQVFSLPPRPPLFDGDREVVGFLPMMDIQDAKYAKISLILTVVRYCAD